MISHERGFGMFVWLIIAAVVVVGCLWAIAKITPISIQMTGSTNSPQSELIVYANGSGQYRTGNDPFLPIPVGVLDHAALLSQILNWQTFNEAFETPIPACAKPVSFSTMTTITFFGKTSGDVSCLSSDTSQGLKKQAQGMLTAAANYLQSHTQ